MTQQSEDRKPFDSFLDNSASVLVLDYVGRSEWYQLMLCTKHCFAWSTQSKMLVDACMSKFVDDEALNRFTRQFPNCHQLVLRRCRAITSSGLSALNKFQNVKILDLSDNQHVANEEGLRNVGQMPQLQSLNLIDCKVSDEAAVAGFRHLIGLKTLKLTPGESFNAERLLVLENLQVLQVSHCNNNLNMNLSVLSDLPNLHHFSYANNTIHLGYGFFADESYFEDYPERKLLASLQPISHLTRLDLCGTSLCDTDIQKLSSSLVHLTHLDLGSYVDRYISSSPSNLTDAGLSYLSSLKQLEVLNLAFTSISDVQHLTALTNLRDLNLQGCNNLHNDFMDHIAKLLQLEQLNLFGVSQVKDEQVGSLERLSNLRVLDIDETSITPERVKQLQAYFGDHRLSITYTYYPYVEILELGEWHLKHDASILPLIQQVKHLLSIYTGGDGLGNIRMYPKERIFPSYHSFHTFLNKMEVDEDKHVEEEEVDIRDMMAMFSPSDWDCDDNKWRAEFPFNTGKRVYSGDEKHLYNYQVLHFDSGDVFFPMGEIAPTLSRLIEQHRVGEQCSISSEDLQVLTTLNQSIDNLYQLWLPTKEMTLKKMCHYHGDGNLFRYAFEDSKNYYSLQFIWG